MSIFKTKVDPGVWQTFVAMSLIYFVFMMIGAMGYRIPPLGWRPESWQPPTTNGSLMITTRNVALENAHKTPQFWLIWAVLCLNVAAGIGIIGAASPMLQETFGGRLFGRPEVGFAHFTDAQKAIAATVGAAFVGLFSLFNIAGRFFWASLSDYIGRKSTYVAFFVLGFICYALTPSLAAAGSLGLFVVAFCIIASMYGGGFATIPAYLADMFGTRYVGAIHGRLLTAWSTAGIFGPVIVNYFHDTRKAAGVPVNELYYLIMYILAALLVLGFIANWLIRPVDPRWYMTDSELDVARARTAKGATIDGGSFGIGRGGLDANAALAWAVVLIPIAWGVWLVVSKLGVLFQ
jgi:MFS family permease